MDLGLTDTTGADLKELNDIAGAGTAFPVPMTGPGRDPHEVVLETRVANAPLTTRRSTEMAVTGWELPLPAAPRLNAGPNPYLSEDREEGVRAFVEKRAPVWKGR